VGLRRGDGGREGGKDLGGTGFWGQKNGYRRCTAVFQNQIFSSSFFFFFIFFIKWKKKILNI
jgi:hypothetical protein